jgi:hypothetical protein
MFRCILQKLAAPAVLGRRAFYAVRSGARTVSSVCAPFFYPFWEECAPFV